MRRSLRDVGFQTQGSGKNIAAKSYVGKVEPAAHIHQQEHVAARTYGAVGRGVPQDASRQACDGKSQCLQRMTEQSIVLKAPSAATAGDQFRLKGLRIQRHRPTQKWIQVLEGNGRG